MYRRTVRSPGVKGLFNIRKALWLLIPSEWVVSIICGKDGMSCPVLTSDPSRAALVFSWVVSLLWRGLVLGDLHLALSAAWLCSG